MKFILKSLQNIDNLISFIFSNNADEKKYLIDKFKKRKIICFDIGANLGGYINFISNNLNVKELHVFEPSKQCVSFLKSKYTKKNCQIINKAVSNRNKISNFYENEILSQSSLYKNKNKFNKDYNYNKKYKINCISLDNYCKNFSKKFKIDILKIDAEGEDLNVLKGSQILLKQKKIKVIKIELLNSINKKNNKSNLIEICNFLNKNGYYLSTIVKSKFNNNKLLMMDSYFEVL
jgi:FkbM family methyltransferase